MAGNKPQNKKPRSQQPGDRALRAPWLMLRGWAETASFHGTGQRSLHLQMEKGEEQGQNLTKPFSSAQGAATADTHISTQDHQDDTRELDWAELRKKHGEQAGCLPEPVSRLHPASWQDGLRLVQR